MLTTDELRRQILSLAPDEAEELVQWVLERIGPTKHPRHQWPTWLSGIDVTPGVCGGEARIVRTRIPVWTLEQMRRLGMSEADILRSYPTLRAEDLVHAWAYVDVHREEIDEQIRANDEA